MKERKEGDVGREGERKGGGKWKKEREREKKKKKGEKVI